MKISKHTSAMGRLRRYGAGFLVLVSLLAFSPVAEAKYASMVINADTGEVLHETNADTRNYPASLTKMMTLYLMFEALESGKLTRNTKITFSPRAARQPASKLGVPAGQSITVQTAMEALAIKSANDVASAVAEKLGGSERNFALIMTAKARKLGMSRTNFRNASGLPHSAQMSTARDMATLAQALIRDFPKEYALFSKKTFHYDGRTYRNTNKLLRTYAGTDGLKTGYIRASGFNLVTSAKRNGVRLIGVVFGGRTSKARNYHMARLLDEGYDILNSQQIALNVAIPPRKPDSIATAAPTVTKAAPPVQVTKAETPPSVTAPARTEKPGADWGIQVGAYKEYAPALEMAKKAVSMASNELNHGYVAVVPLNKKNGRVLYRARVLGLDKQEAYRACRVVERNKIGCMELKRSKLDEVAAVR